MKRTFSLFRSFSSKPSKMSASSQHPLIAFFEGTGSDPHGRYLRDILQWSDRRLESSHDYIQTVFPLPEASGVNWDAEVIDKTVFEAFRSREELQDSLRTAFKRILRFYGFNLSTSTANNGKLLCKRVPNFNDAAKNWVYRYDHNHLRITRIIRSLRVLGLQDEARAFFLALKDVQAQSAISNTSLTYWTRAMERPLNIRPDVEEEEEHEDLGPQFLREFVRSQQQEGEKTNEGINDIAKGINSAPANAENTRDNGESKEESTMLSKVDNPSRSASSREAEQLSSIAAEPPVRNSDLPHSTSPAKEGADNGSNNGSNNDITTDAPEAYIPLISDGELSPFHTSEEEKLQELIRRSRRQEEAVIKQDEKDEGAPKSPVS